MDVFYRELRLLRGSKEQLTEDGLGAIAPNKRGRTNDMSLRLQAATYAPVTVPENGV